MHQPHCETGGLKAGAAFVFVRIRIALRTGLESLWRSGMRPPSIPSGLNRFPSLTFVDLDPIAPGDGTGADEPDPFKSADRSSPRARPAIVQARRPSGSRPYAGR